ncbi:MAG: hypothetical protein ISN29_00870 [Gammaproteobacteria bacterium AqS3]|nr:hypothetical protein [Gammaproteobacteria bacterium AqS3]
MPNCSEDALVEPPQPVFDVLPACFVDSGIGSLPDGWEVDSAVVDPRELFCCGIILGLASGDVRVEAARG